MSPDSLSLFGHVLVRLIQDRAILVLYVHEVDKVAEECLLYKPRKTFSIFLFVVSFGFLKLSLIKT